MKNQIVQTAPFVDLVTVTTAQAVNPIFDIIIEEEVTLQKYCEAIIKKIADITRCQLAIFINYQMNLAKDPLQWLVVFEKLIDNNEELFASKKAVFRFNKIYSVIDEKRIELRSSRVKTNKTKTPKKYINAESEERYFSFYEVKNHIKSLESYSEKVLFLNEEICEYKQSELYFVNSKLLDYKMQCKDLLKSIQNARNLKSQLEKEQFEENEKRRLEIKPIFKIQLNGPINILTDSYKQMMTSIKPNGKPYIQYKIKEIAKFICDNYLDENGKELSMHTIQTYLSPNRTDKNPNHNWKIKL